MWGVACVASVAKEVAATHVFGEEVLLLVGGLVLLSHGSVLGGRPFEDARVEDAERGLAVNQRRVFLGQRLGVHRGEGLFSQPGRRGGLKTGLGGPVLEVRERHTGVVQGDVTGVGRPGLVLVDQSGDVRVVFGHSSQIQAVLLLHGLASRVHGVDFFFDLVVLVFVGVEDRGVLVFFVDEGDVDKLQAALQLFNGGGIALLGPPTRHHLPDLSGHVIFELEADVGNHANRFRVALNAVEEDPGEVGPVDLSDLEEEHGEGVVVEGLIVASVGRAIKEARVHRLHPAPLLCPPPLRLSHTTSPCDDPLTAVLAVSLAVQSVPFELEVALKEAVVAGVELLSGDGRQHREVHSLRFLHRPAVHLFHPDLRQVAVLAEVHRTWLHEARRQVLPAGIRAAGRVVAHGTVPAAPLEGLHVRHSPGEGVVEKWRESFGIPVR